MFSNKEGFSALVIIEGDGIMRVLSPKVENNLHNTPSGAASELKRLAVKKDRMKHTSVNGWTFWYVMRRRDNSRAPLSREDLANSFGPMIDAPIIDFILLDDLRKKFRERQ